jgi:hypothetical protein
VPVPEVTEAMKVIKVSDAVPAMVERMYASPSAGHARAADAAKAVHAAHAVPPEPPIEWAGNVGGAASIAAPLTMQRFFVAGAVLP